jgi:hypothetical protein
VLDIASGKETVITKAPGKYLQPAFSPDGKSVSFVKAKGGYLTTPWHGMETGVYVAAELKGSGVTKEAIRNGQPLRCAVCEPHQIHR